MAITRRGRPFWKRRYARGPPARRGPVPKLLCDLWGGGDLPSAFGVRGTIEGGEQGCERRLSSLGLNLG